MAIQEQNIVYLKTQVMDDVDEGGSAAIGDVVVDGAMNNVFEDISTWTAPTAASIYANSRQPSARLTRICTAGENGDYRLPTDTALGYALFTTDDPFDVRSDAANRVEAYLYKGPLWPGALNENHIKGMQAISVIQRVNTALPPVGKTLCLVQDEGYRHKRAIRPGRRWMRSKPRLRTDRRLCALDRDDELVQRSALRL